MMYTSRNWLNAWILGLVTLSLASCSDEPAPVANRPKAVQGEVTLKSDSPKQAYIKRTRLEYSQPPVLDSLPGRIVYLDTATARVSSPVSGRVLGQPVALGTRVHQGATLLELISPDSADAEADDQKAQAQLTLASKAWQRQKELYEGMVIARKELEQAEDDLNQARSERQRTANRLKNLRLEHARANGQFTLKAPLTGVVVERNVNPGQEITPNQEPPLFVISDLSTLTLLMDVFEMNLSKIKVGQKINVSVPAYPGEQFPAIVRYIGQVLDEKTHSVQVRCELPNPDGRLLPGMYASISVQSMPDEQAIVIPLTAVYTQNQSDYVFVAVEPNRFVERPIKLGLRLKDRAVVTEGLQVGEQLVSEGALILRAEEQVEAAGETAAQENSK